MTRSEKRNRNRRNMTERVAASLGGLFRISRAGVPHIVLDVGSGRRASVCFFARTRKWRVFFPYCEFDKQQIKTTHEGVPQVMDRLAELRREVACGKHSS